MRGQQRGFTLVELVVVIVILGILAAVALPRFADLQAETRYAKLQAVAGSIKAASAMVRSAFLVQQGASATAPTSVTVELGSGASSSGTVGITNGFASYSGIAVAANLETIDGITFTGTPLVVSITGAPAACKVTYTEASGSTPPVINLPAYSTAPC